MKVALLGNPNAGKSTLFNQLTGLHQKVGNFPGVTVDKKTGLCRLDKETTVELIDLPGTYSLYPKSLDESIVLQTLIHTQNKGASDKSASDKDKFDKDKLHENKPDLVVVVVDASNLKRNLLLFTQVKDLGLPVVLALNLMDVAQHKGLNINIEKLSQIFETQIISINARTGKNIDELKKAILQKIKEPTPSNGQYVVNAYFLAPRLVQIIQEEFELDNVYEAFQYAHQFEHFDFLNPAQKAYLKSLTESHHFNSVALQSKETLARYEILEDIIKQAINQDDKKKDTPTFSEA
jgi:ferrous iron transport protein B